MWALNFNCMTREPVMMRPLISYPLETVMSDLVKGSL